MTDDQLKLQQKGKEKQQAKQVKDKENKSKQQITNDKEP